MPLIDRIRTELAAAHARPWQITAPDAAVPANAVEIGAFTGDVDALLAFDATNAVDGFVALYDAASAYQASIAELEALMTKLGTQRKALAAAIAGLAA